MIRRSRTLALSTCAAAVAVLGAGLPAAAVVPTLAGTWTRVAVPAGPTGQPLSMAYDPVHGQLLAIVDDPNTGPETAVLQGGMWQVAGPPPPASPPTPLVFDPTINQVVVIANLCAATWTGTAWSAATCTSTNPSDFAQTRAAGYDAHLGAVVDVVDLSTGNCCAGQYDGTETWSFDGQSWTKLSPTTQPSPLTAPQPVEYCPDVSCVGTADTTFTTWGDAAWDPTQQTLVMVGDLNRTWTWNGSTWSGGVAVAPGAAKVSVAYDPALGRIVAYGDPEQTSSWNGTAWQPVATTATIQPPWGPLAYDSALGGVAMLGEPLGTAPKPTVLWLFTPGVSAP